jgi:hypothetical protein
VTPCLLVEVYHPVGGMAPSIFRVEDYVVWKKTSGLLSIFYHHLASCRHALCILFFYPLISCHLLPSSSVPPHPFLTSFLVLQQPRSADIDTNTSTPTQPFQACLYLLSSPQPLLVLSIPDIPHHFLSPSIFFCHCDTGRKFIQNGGKVIASFHVHTYSSFMLILIFYLTFNKSTNKNKVGYRTCQE